jgi:predicted esterase
MVRRLLPLLLSAIAIARAIAGEAVEVKTEYERFRRTRVVITAPPALVGRHVVLRQGEDELSNVAFAAVDGKARASLAWPMPAFDDAGSPIACMVDGKELARFSLPDPAAARRRAAAELPFVFRPAVFASDKLPSGDFKEVSLAEDVFGGSYTVTTTVYDAEGDPVTSATRPGRYGAVVAIAGVNGVSTRRFLTLYRQPGSVNWRQADLALSAMLPPETGIDPAVAGEQGGVLGDYLKERLQSGFSDGSGAAMLFACLHETAPGAGRLPQRLSPAERDARWWLGLRKKLGLITHRYLEFLPQTYAADAQARFPLILFLHGSGERGVDIEDVRKHGPHHWLTAHDNPCIIIEPQCDPGQWWHPCEVIDLLDEVRTKYRIDDARIYLTGLSMGGFGSWATAIEYPERFAAVVPICGRGDPAEAARMKDLPCWIFHGARDPAVALAFSQEMADALTKLGAKPQFTIYPEVGHDSWTEAYNTPALYEWLFKQRRK